MSSGENQASTNKNMSIRMRTDEDHEVLGSEFCSDYQDRFGKWNQGFHCPSEDGSIDVYCCGTDVYKYCCTKKEVMQPSEIPDLAIVLGILLGTIFAITLITILSCFFCSCCLLYKRRHANVNGGPLYQMHCSSTASGVANMYSFSNQNSSATTPVENTGQSTLVDLDYHHHHHQSATNGNNAETATPPTPLQRHHHRPQSFATVDLIPANAKAGNYGGNGNDDDEGVSVKEAKKEVRFENVLHDDAPPPYEEANLVTKVTAAAAAAPVPVVVSEELPMTEPSVPLSSTSPNVETENQQGLSHLTAGSPSSTGKSSHSSHTSVNSNQAATSPSSDETLYWSTKF